MIMTHIEERKLQDEFAQRAAVHFRDNPEHWSYTDGEIKAGEFFALRFGMGEDCVVIFTVGDEPLNYQQLI